MLRSMSLAASAPVASVAMVTARQARQALKWLLFGSASFSQYRPMGLRDPQSEVSVWLHGLGAPRDVTYNNVVAAARPFTVGIGLENGLDVTGVGLARPSLRFHDRGRENWLLGEIRLRLTETIPVGGGQLYLFEAKNCRNYCVPKAWLWMRYLYYAYQRWHARRHPNAPEIRMAARDVHCLLVFYICPRPVVLVSVVDGSLANIFPMDLIGPIGAEHFSLALHSTSTAVPLMERSRRIALSSVPVEQTAVAYQLGKNHKEQCVDWDHLPFPTTTSAAFGLPVPAFSLRVREMQIEAARTIGSYRLFLAHTIEDQWRAHGPQFFLAHGFYQAWKHARG